MRAAGLSIDDGSEENSVSGVARTLKAMESEVDIIFQPTLKDDSWSGRADYFRKVQCTSKLGDWSYEVIDTKLAR